jgi:hypothetical protein
VLHVLAVHLGDGAADVAAESQSEDLALPLTQVGDRHTLQQREASTAHELAE